MIRKSKLTCTISLLPCLLAFLAVQGQCASEEPWQKTVDVVANDMPLSGVLECLFRDTGMSYVVEPELAGLKVTATIKSVPLQSAFHTLLRTAGATYRKDGKVLAISAKEKPRATPWAIPADPSTLRTEVVKLRFLTAGEVARSFGDVPGIFEVTAASSNALVLTGTREALGQARAIVEAVDSEKSLLRTVYVRVDVTARQTVSGEEPRIYRESVSGVVPEGRPSHLQLSGLLPASQAPSGVKRPTSRYVSLYVNVEQCRVLDPAGLAAVRTTAGSADPTPTKPASGGDGPSIVLRCSGSMTFQFSTCQIQSQPEFTASVPPGVPTVVATGSDESEAGKVDYEITVTARIQGVWLPQR